MKAADRSRIRQAVDAAQRERRQARIQAHTLTVCAGCQIGHDDYTPGCPTCSHRKANRKRNQNPDYRQAAAAARRERRAKA